MSDPFIGEVALFPYYFAPLGWSYCDGTLVSVQQNPALYTVLGNTYGGTINVSFQLPNLQGRVPVGVGQGPGLSNRLLGATAGTETVTLTNVNQLPVHNHTLQGTIPSNVQTGTPTSKTRVSIATNIAASPPAGIGINAYNSTNPINTTLNAASIGPTGGANPQAHENRQPYLTVPFCIATDGIFPIPPQ